MKQLVTICLVLLLTACEAEKLEVIQPSPVVEQKVLDVVAEVNGEMITQTELDQMAVDLFGEYQANLMNQVSRQKLLDSMVSTLALSQKSLAVLSDDERTRIENKTRRYRENLLVSEYVRNSISPQPVTDLMIKDYYEKNLALFGASEVPRYQLLTTRQPLAIDQRNAFLKKYAELKSEPSLQRVHQEFQSSGFDTAYQTGLAEPGLLPEKLQQIIASQTPGRLSDVHYLDDLPYLILVDEIVQIKAKPLNQVRNSIRKTLAMSQLKGEVKSLSEMVKQEASITIH